VLYSKERGTSQDNEEKTQVQKSSKREQEEDFREK
jgi:hypothetical protein